MLKNKKKKYAGHELTGKSLGVIGCGAIGIQVANLALRFGMKFMDMIHICQSMLHGTYLDM